MKIRCEAIVKMHMMASPLSASGRRGLGRAREECRLNGNRWIAEDGGNLLATFTLTQKLHDFPLPIGDPTLFGSPFEGLFSLNISRENDLRDPRCEKMFVLGECFDRLD